jgi:hyperosmotically inducible periplasmic protein
MEVKYMLQRLSMIASAAALVVTAACAQTDSGITTAVKSKFAADNTVKAYQIDVDTANHVVTLTGTVDSPAAKDKAVVLARQTDGVTDVVDRITVDQAGAAPTSGELRREAGEAADDTKEAAKEAGRDARDAASDATQRTGEVVSDSAITAAVKSKMLADTTAPGLKIDVDTKDGVVTLNGTVRTKAEADRAMALARETNGVKRVVNNLKIQA